MAYTHNVLDITPEMTANDAPSPYVVSASTEYGADYAAWKAFNHLNNADLTQWIAQSTITAGWLKFYFGEESHVVTSYSIYCFNDAYKTYMPNTWTFQGSNDDSAWTTLDTRSGITWIADQTQTFSFSNSTGHKYYRINITANNGASAGLVLFELEMFETLPGPINGLQKIPHDSNLARDNKIELVNIANRNRIGTVGTTKHNYIGA